MNADQIKAQYPGYVGWNDKAAIVADFKATGGQGKGGPSSSGGGGSSGDGGSSGGGGSYQAPAPIDLVAQARQLNEFNIQQNQPAITAMQGSKQPLIDRYNAVLEGLKGRETQQIESATLATSNELGRRGILPGSGFGVRQLQGATQPIASQYSAQYGQLGAAQAGDISDIDRAIAALQAGNSSESVSQALSMLTLNQNQRQFDAAQANAKSNLLDTEVITAGGRKKLVNKQTGQVISDLGASTDGTGTGTGTDNSWLQYLFPQGQTNTAPAISPNFKGDGPSWNSQFSTGKLPTPTSQPWSPPKINPFGLTYLNR